LTILAFAYVSLLVVVLADPEGWLSRALQARWLRWLGLVSYSTYLLHGAVLMLAHGLLLNRDQRFPLITDASSALTTLFALAVTLALAGASWRWFEAPILRLKRHVPSPRRPKNQLVHA
jgi:peptidoglycan/LPS O-acetylase OafA/YrhL